MIVDCDYRKWGDVQHWRFSIELLGTDEHGTWLGGPAPVSYIGPRGDGAFTYPFVLLVPEKRWWTVTFNAENDVELYADITTVPTWPGSAHMTCVDLDLDVYRRRSGEIVLDDEDEFEEHLVEYHYPDEVIDGARASAAWLLEAVAERREPFDTVGLRWLERVAGT